MGQTMKKKSEILLPKVAEEIPNGGVYRQEVRCGRKTCRCETVGQKHQAFYLLVRVNGKQRKKYVPKADVAVVKSLVESARQSRKEFRADQTQALLTFRTIREFVKSVGR